MIENIKSFKVDLTHFMQVVTPKNHLELQVRIAARLHQLIVANNSDMPRHPTDTGWAKANWGVSLGQPRRTPIGTYPGKGIPTSLPMFNLASVLAKAKPFGIIWVWNNVPYIVSLENGHSDQAPHGMVEGALHDIQTFMNQL